MRCTLNKRVGSNESYKLNLISLTGDQSLILEKMNNLDVVDINIIAPAELAECEQASTNSQSDAIALWGEALLAWNNGELVKWFGNNGKRINAAVA